MTEGVQRGTGVTLKTRPHGETSLIIDFFTREYGMISGYMRGGRLTKNAGAAQIGAVCDIERYARLPEQLGTVTCELVHILPAALSYRRLTTSAFFGLCDLIPEILPPHAPEPQLYEGFIYFAQLQEGEADMRFFALYLIEALKISGYAPDWRQCAVTGSPEVRYVSPKTGAAVSKEIATPYKERLYPLPAFIRNPAAPASARDIAEGVRLALFVSDKFLLQPAGKTLPPLLADLPRRLNLTV